MRTVALLVSLLLFHAICADDLRLSDGRVLQNYRVIDHDAFSLMVVYAGGAENARCVKLCYTISILLAKNYECDNRKRSAGSDV